MSVKAGYPYIAKAIRIALDVQHLPAGVYPSIDPDTYDGWYDSIVWYDESVEKPSKETLETIIAQIKEEHPEYASQQFDVII